MSFVERRREQASNDYRFIRRRFNSLARPGGIKKEAFAIVVFRYARL